MSFRKFTLKLFSLAIVCVTIVGFIVVFILSKPAYIPASFMKQD